MMAASCSSATFSRPAGTERASWIAYSAGMPEGRRLRAFASASCAVVCRYS